MTETAPAATEPQKTPEPATAPEQPSTALQVVPKPQLPSGNILSAIVPTSYDEAFRMARAFAAAGMVPDSYIVDNDRDATCARVSIGIMKGMEIGLPPVTALSTICVINSRPCLWGDGAVALIQQSGKLEWMRDSATGEWNKQTYVHTVTAKRVGNPEPITRTFGFKDAKLAGLITKGQAWPKYPERMCFNRARAWVARDGFSDVLMGIGIAEEVRDIEVEANRAKTPPDLSKLDYGMPPVAQIDTVATTEQAEPKDALEEMLDNAQPAAEPLPDDWQAVIDSLSPALKKCENMAQFQLFWLDNTKVIESFVKAPQEVRDAWEKMVIAQKSRFTKK